MGEPLVWATGAALAAILMFAAGLILIVLANGLGYFWPSGVSQLTLADGSAALGEITAREPMPEDPKKERVQLKVGNRDLYGMDFRWIELDKVVKTEHPSDAVVLERQEHGNFYGYLAGLKTASDANPPDPSHPAAGNAPPSPSFPLAPRFNERSTATANAQNRFNGFSLPDNHDALWAQLRAAHEKILLEETNLQSFNKTMNRLSEQKEDLRNKILKLEYRDKTGNAKQIAACEAQGRQLDQEFARLSGQAGEKFAALRTHEAVFKDATGKEKAIPLVDIVRLWRPNRMSFFQKTGYAFSTVWGLLSQDPRESNTEGGLFPAIFGTVMMVFLMSLFSVPLGVVAAVYLREYAKEGILVRLVRIAVGNLAGVPSIVYGVFGLGFFVYGLGGSIDRLFYPERLPSPTFGTGGLLWASLTLALLTVPVVIVATEEALAAVPRGIREGSLALGATKFQTLVRILLPMASPGIMTGLILAMARAAGEVAPLMIVGVVKLAPKLPLDGRFPFMHLDRKFMHLGFHIYDVGFQSPNVEAAKPMVFVTTLLLLLIVMAMSALAIYLRNKMSKRYASGVF